MTVQSRLDVASAALGADEHEEHHDDGSTTTFGFWIYLMSDCILFSAVFAAFAVLRDQTAGGPTARELFSLPYVAVETACLLVSSFTYGMAMIAVERGKRGARAVVAGRDPVAGRQLHRDGAARIRRADP